MSALVPPGGGYTAGVWRGHSDPARAALAVLCGLVGYLMAIALVAQAVIGVAFSLLGKGRSWNDYNQAATRFELPSGMLAAHLAIGSLIVVALLVCRYVLGLSPGRVVSVSAGFRWGYLAAVTVVAALVFLLMLAVTLHPRLSYLHPQRDYAAFMVIVVLTSPLQAAAEEFFFRGLLMNALGVATQNRFVLVLGPALIFALLHGPQSLPLFLDRFCFGVIAGLLVLRTGGLEAGIATHIANNILAFGLAGLMGTIAQARTLTTVDWATAAWDVGSFAVIALAAWALARAFRLRVTAGDGTGLSRPGAVR